MKKKVLFLLVIIIVAGCEDFEEKEVVLESNILESNEYEVKINNLLDSEKKVIDTISRDKINSYETMDIAESQKEVERIDSNDSNSGIQSALKTNTIGSTPFSLMLKRNQINKVDPAEELLDMMIDFFSEEVENRTFYLTDILNVNIDKIEKSSDYGRAVYVGLDSNIVVYEGEIESRFVGEISPIGHSDDVPNDMYFIIATQTIYFFSDDDAFYLTNRMSKGTDME